MCQPLERSGFEKGICEMWKNYLRRFISPERSGRKIRTEMLDFLSDSSLARPLLIKTGCLLPRNPFKPEPHSDSTWSGPVLPLPVRFSFFRNK
jgi:hypothetical protein